mmetsp:Transcript_50156/g.83303  ORF Transcript_50156/g.83303 Transcript_50156/m.83303 type:complete len:92 (-) Transcript_50156:752-1027(-)
MMLAKRNHYFHSGLHGSWLNRDSLGGTSTGDSLHLVIVWDRQCLCCFFSVSQAYFAAGSGSQMMCISSQKDWPHTTTFPLDLMAAKACLAG